tara:strand:+ start:1710 stop:2195 length:486 start_codon:yes stop_codon:yes gene_type:complete
MRNAGVKFVEAFRLTIAEYYGKDSRSCDNVQFLLQELDKQGMPKYHKACKRLVSLYLPVTIKKDGTVENKGGIEKGVINKMNEAQEAYDWGILTSVLNHDALNIGKEEQAFDKAKFLTRLQGEAIKGVEKGVTLDELLAVMQAAVQAQAAVEAEAELAKAA